MGACWAQCGLIDPVKPSEIGTVPGRAIGRLSGGARSFELGGLSACRNVVVWAFDLKRGIEARPVASCIEHPVTAPGSRRFAPPSARQELS